MTLEAAYQITSSIAIASSICLIGRSYYYYKALAKIKELEADKLKLMKEKINLIQNEIDLRKEHKDYIETIIKRVDEINELYEKINPKT